MADEGGDIMTGRAGGGPIGIPKAEGADERL